MEKRRQRRRQSLLASSSPKDDTKLVVSRNDGAVILGSNLRSSNVKDGGTMKTISKNKQNFSQNIKKPLVGPSVQSYNSQNKAFDIEYQYDENIRESKVIPNTFHDLSPMESSNSDCMTSLSEEKQQRDLNYCETASESGEGSQDEESVVSIVLIYCEHCKKSYAPETSKKFCQALDEDGNPKCLKLGGSKKRKVFNSAKVRRSKIIMSHMGILSFLLISHSLF